MRFLITAGPTREYLDPVRFLSNGSTGKMGYACAATAVKLGHKVTLISGPTALPRPAGVKFIPVVSAQEMAQKTLEAFPNCDCVIMTAAVCDYQPAKIAKHKMQKQTEDLLLQLTRTPDILAQLGQQKTHQKLIGFAVQDRAAKTNARRKLENKNLDAIILNGPAAFAADRTDAHILTPPAPWQTHTNITKAKLAQQIIKIAQKLYRPA
ncbi:MAG: phosphopantothenoylcysteine decarboxylase [Sedimentisphaerales bacterium]|nr:phosphopantothenoylcysteine decarboxylase [Sedimentisphaerales bacterium]